MGLIKNILSVRAAGDKSLKDISCGNNEPGHRSSEVPHSSRCLRGHGLKTGSGIFHTQDSERERLDVSKIFKPLERWIGLKPQQRRRRGARQLRKCIDEDLLHHIETDQRSD